MADFVDNSASEASGSDSEDDIDKTKKKSVSSSSSSSSGSGDSSEEDEDEDGVVDGLIDDNPIEEDASDNEDSDPDTVKRKKRSDDEDDQLEEEDFDLIEENLGIKVKRNKHKRIKVMSDDEDSENEATRENEADVVANQIFGDEDDDDAASTREEPTKSRSTTNVSGADNENQYAEIDESEESDPDDFIVDESGQPISKGKKKKTYTHSDRALQEAQDIFGVDFDYGDVEEHGSEYEEEEEEEEEEYDEEDGAGGEPTARKKRTRPGKKTIFEVFEPSELERGHLTDVDQEIRTADIPERFHMRSIKVSEADPQELQDEAEWIFTHAFSRPYLTNQESLATDRKESRALIKKINSALDFLRNQQLEVPFIAFYRKEYVQPELKIRDLWKIWQWDEKWAQLRSRKQNLIKLMERMQQYQFDMNSNPDKVLPSYVRTITQDDIDRVKLTETSEEYWDTHNHFMLYYGRDLQAMKDYEKKKLKDKPPKVPKEKSSDDPLEEKEEGEDDEEMETDKPEEEPPQETLKYATGRNSGYNICVQGGLLDLAKKFGLTPEQFADNLKDNYQRHEVEQFPTEPMELAQEFVGQQFESAAEVLNGARHIIAMQIAHDPVVRKCVRAAYRERAVISVTPTKKGRKEIDENHPCYSIKYLKAKPISELKNEEMLKLNEASEDSLLTLSINMAESADSTTSTYLDEIRPLYLRDEFSALVQAWNAQRSMALERALTKSVYPQLEKELKLKLLEEAKEGIIRGCCDKLRDWLRVAPYQPIQEFDKEDEDFDTSKGLRIMSIAYKSERDVAGFACLLNGDGEVTDFLRLPNIMKRKGPRNNEKEQELNKLKDFIHDRKPHVIAIAAESREALDIEYDMKSLLKQLEDTHQFPKIPIELVDNSSAVVYSVSKKSTQDFPEYPELLREAVSVGRRLRDPLTELSQLCNADEDILCVNFHSMQRQASKDQLLSCLYLEFVNIVNEVGVDINASLTHPYSASLLQFVSGLGPRKATNILKFVKSHKRLENRSQLVTVCQLGPKVFINCAGFIKIDTSSFGDSTEEYTDVLDASRVHPETYEWARKMAIDALEYDDTAEDANPAAALEEILDTPERLRDLDLEAFSVELERQGYGQKLTTLYDIRSELNHRYKDTRTPFKPVEVLDKFNMLTKETPATLYIGKLVLCKVMGIAKKKPQGAQLDEANPSRSDDTGLWVCPFCKKEDFTEISEVWSHFDSEDCPGASVGVRVRLENDLNGFIHTKNLSDKDVRSPEERVKVGMTLHARILKIDIERFQVDLTCKTSDLLDKEDRLRPPKDTFYDYEAEEKDKEVEKKKDKDKKKISFVKRVIAHPSFRNVSYKQCEDVLEVASEGDCVIRPSSKGPDRLTLTWKLAPGIYSHVDIREEGKENAFSLGKTLYIGTEEFEDLDEIIARYLQPMAAFAREIQTYKYYVEDSQGGNRDILDRRVYEEKKKAPARIPYFFSASKEMPGKFMLSYMPKDRTIHEFVTVTHEGYRFRSQMFSSLNSLIKWFKEHYRDIPQKLVNPSSTATPRADGMRPPGYRAGATPAYNTSRSGGTPFNAAHMTPTVMTPSYHTTQSGSTPSYRTPRQGSSTVLRNASGVTPGATPQSGQTPRQSGTTPRYTSSQSGTTPRYTTSSRPIIAPKTNPDTDWGKMALQWAKEQTEKRKLTKDGSSNS